MSTPKFAETHNLVAFLEKPKESNGFEGIIDFLNASSIKYALTVNPIVYESCIQQFWVTTKAKIVNGERQIQALVDKKKVIIIEKSVRHDLMLDDTEGTKCLPNDREGKGFSRRITPLFQSMMVQAPKDMGEDLATPTDSHSTPIVTQPSSSKPQKKKSRRKQRKDSEEAKTVQVKEIASLKKRVKQLEQRKKSRTSGLKRLRKVGSASRVESSNDVSLGAQEDASKQKRKIANLDADEEVTLIDETQERYDEEMLFDVQDDLQGEEVVAKKEVAKKEDSAADLVTTAGEVVTTAKILMEIRKSAAKALARLKMDETEVSKEMKTERACFKIALK
ncbi:hypothetical protein Tco_0899706 [Tanacetum coccineum]